MMIPREADREPPPDATDDDTPDLDLPEPDPIPPPGFASWGRKRDGVPPPYEESADQVDARRRCRGEADKDLWERRRKRIARIKKLAAEFKDAAEEAERLAERARLEERWRAL